jgi:rod shape-determining protein MreD
MASRSSSAFWIFLTFVIILHFVLHLALGLGDGAPDLLTVALLLGARRMRPSFAAGLGLLLGLLNDVSISSFGAESVVLTVLGWLGARSRDLFEGDSLLFVGAYLFLGKLLHDAGYLLLARDLSRGPLGPQLLLHAPMAAVYAAGGGIIALLVYRASTGRR